MPTKKHKPEGEAYRWIHRQLQHITEKETLWKRKALLEQSIAAGEEPEVNSIRKELWEIRYSETADQNSRADGYLKLWMALEFNRDAGKRWFGQKARARKL